MGWERGMKIADPFVRDFHRPNPEKDLPEIKRKSPKIEMVMIVLPRYGDYYGKCIFWVS